MPPSDGPSNPSVHRWLRSRIDRVLDEDDEELPTVRAPGVVRPNWTPPQARRPAPRPPPAQAQPAPMALRPPTIRSGDPPDPVADPPPPTAHSLADVEDELETVLASQWAGGVALGAGPVVEPDFSKDSDTVRRHRVALGFIGEAVMDDATVEDPRSSAVRWRDEGMFVLPTTIPPLEPSPSRAPRRAAPAQPHIVPHGFSVPPPRAPTPPALPSVSPRLAGRQRPPPPPALRTALPQTPMALEPVSESTVDPPRMLHPLPSPAQYLVRIAGGLLLAGLACLIVLAAVALLLV